MVCSEGCEKRKETPVWKNAGRGREMEKQLPRAVHKLEDISELDLSMTLRNGWKNWIQLDN